MGDQNDKARRTTDDTDQGHDEIPAGRPRQPIPEESQFMPDTGDRPPSPSGRSEEDIMEEARDGFMDRYPPKGQTS